MANGAALSGYVMAWHMTQPPDFRSKELELELKYKNRQKRDRLPRRPGDGYTILGMIAGLILGGIIGKLSGNGLIFTGLVIAGGVAGTWLGSLVQPLINKLKQQRAKKREEQRQGPFT